ncbi:MAG: molybdenum cofactor guanylyltransferase [Gammaproteobacteria bacterium]|nr:molybdenum cofactor guanylyltransferase [Gammaproteobacteria bacterium]
MTLNKAKLSTTGIILAGGAASRMHNQDKGLLLLKQKTLISYVIHRIAPQTKTLIISCNRNIPHYKLLGYPTVQDIEQQFNGPLAGILSGLAQVKTSYTFIAPCDSPNIPENIVFKLYHALLNADADIAIPFDGIRTQPLFILFKTALKEDLESFIMDGGKAAHKWINRHRSVKVDFLLSDDAFLNINTPEELKNFERK